MYKQIEEWDNEDNVVSNNWFKFNQPEDKIFGTLTDKRQVKSNLPGKEGSMVWIYSILAQSGSFHKLDDKKKIVEEPIEIKSGESWSVGGTAIIDRQMQNIRVGQVIGLKFVEEKPSKTKGFAPAKIIKVYSPRDETGAPLVDKEWLESNPDVTYQQF